LITFYAVNVILFALTSLNPLIATLKPQSNGPSNSNTMIGTMAVDGWAVTFGIQRGGDWAGPHAAHPGPSSLYQMQQPTHQRPVYQLRIIRCSTIICLWSLKGNVSTSTVTVIAVTRLPNCTFARAVSSPGL